MKWFSDIKDLQYYTQPKGVSCYCEQLVYPSDMHLQGTIPAGQGSGNYNISIEVWSPDGLTIYEVATAYFDYYFAVNPVTSLHYFNARLRSFSPAMCSHQCFLIRVGVTNVSDPDNYLFANWTERWCVHDCCDTARGIEIAQAGMTTSGGGSTGTTTVPASSSKHTGECGEPLLRIISVFDCIDRFTGEFYGNPGAVLSGAASFNYAKVTTLKGRIVRRPREIKKEVSYNCRIQRVESTPVYLLEGFEYFPDWKMYEIEGQLHANRIWIDDYNTYHEYRYDGGTPFKQVHKCFELFKLEAVLQDCTQRQVFGCVSCANTASGSIYYMIPSAYNGGAFYADNGTLIANDYDGLLLYYNSLYGAVAEDTDTAGMSCAVYKLMKVSGYGIQQLPFYFDAPLSANKVYGRVAADTDELCAGLGPVCAKPVAGTPVVADMVCAAPVTGTVVVTDITPLDVALPGYGDWVADAVLTYASLYRNEVRLSMKLTNGTITEDPDAPGEAVDILNEPIAVIGAAARPYAIVVLSNDNNSAIPEGLIITIDSHGMVRASGPCTGATPANVTIELTDIVYNI